MGLGSWATDAPVFMV